MSDNPYQVYKEWSLDEINQAISEFNDMMHDGGDIEEIEAGLLCLDFLTRKSTLDTKIEARLVGCETEARMRIELLQIQRDEKKTMEERVEHTQHTIRMLTAALRSIDRMMRIRADEVDVIAHVKRIVEAKYKQ